MYIFVMCFAEGTQVWDNIFAELLIYNADVVLHNLTHACPLIKLYCPMYLLIESMHHFCETRFIELTLSHSVGTTMGILVDKSGQLLLMTRQHHLST